MATGRHVRRYTPEERERIAEMFAEGALITEIAEEIGNATYYQIKDAIRHAQEGEWGKGFVERFPKRPKGGCNPPKEETNTKSSGRRKKPEKPKPSETLEEAIRHADALGMTYGKYIQMKGL